MFKFSIFSSKCSFFASFLLLSSFTLFSQQIQAQTEVYALEDDTLSTIKDPYENLNRVIFKVNMVGDKILLKPVAVLYKKALPEIARKGIGNSINNLKEPLILLNDVAQADLKQAGITSLRFLLNSTAGLGGFVDVATPLGLTYRPNDFGQTLARYGLARGPYIVLPLLGPSSGRHAAGRLVDTVVDPIKQINVSRLTNGRVKKGDVTLGRLALSTIHARQQVLDELDALEESSVDFYAAVRSLYSQIRQHQLKRFSKNATAPAGEIILPDEDLDGFDE